MRDSEDVLRSLRGMAWERTKGEIRSVLMTFYPEYDRNGRYIEGNFSKLDKKVKEFIEYVEDNGLHE